HFDDGLLGGLIDIGHEVVVLLFCYADAVQVEGGAVDNGGATARGFDGRIEHWVHTSFRKISNTARGCASRIRRRSVNKNEKERCVAAGGKMPPFANAEFRYFK